MTLYVPASTVRLLEPSASKATAAPSVTENENASGPSLPPLSFTTTLLTISVPASSSLVIVHSLVPPLGTTTSTHELEVTLYPATAGSVTLYVPASTVRLFEPSASKDVGAPPLTENENASGPSLPPLSFTTTLLTISVPAWSSLVTVHSLTASPTARVTVPSAEQSPPHTLAV